MSADTPCVLISYSHDSRAHCDQVLEFAQQLRRVTDRRSGQTGSHAEA